MSSFAIYMIGALILIAALAYGAMLMGAPQIWIMGGAAVLVGLIIMQAAVRTRRQDKPESAE